MLRSLDNFVYDEDTLRLLATNFEDPDVLFVFKMVCKYHNFGGFIKKQLPNYESKRRKYDNAFLILESTKFIKRMRFGGPSTPYFISIRGEKLVEFFINEMGMPMEEFKLSLADKEKFGLGHVEK
ncbi:hypothetical protein [Paenibacillus larvae]|uniref:Uncharacterized protein n=1 Tax=Paenibacillus larvae subsp. larvae TaxID=147375 RepID=A0A2L1U786_9BACL|nr:hypothetical protein [Paenibacillus larvae]AVF28797.1 hypothetical protein ERICIII_04793 [Paenibacillus larvae subsp. larvae]MCY9499059.1 hypothetical protein [Paenibacillus larvae]MCY9745348.1 hypothetical protein [Paenibacillus larvae]MCY9750220.1 hypothetical protein [Paenibacillus larvae]MDR5608813.1 hypothetical protein [Paenibacillus larvae]